MIPKKIHYCWFGRNPLPESAKKCIDSWKKYLPDYEIIEWNEDNFDINTIPYTTEAYEAKKYAFVSDYARMKILYEQGGVYFDTDVEVIAPMDDIIEKGSFMGFELNPSSRRQYGAIGPGLGLGAIARLPLYKTILDYYSTLSFILPDGTYNTADAIVNITTRELVKVGLKDVQGIQEVDSITVYPADYFNPLEDATGKLNKTKNTRSIHWYSKTWINTTPAREKLSRLFHRVFGVHTLTNIRNFFKK